MKKIYMGNGFVKYEKSQSEKLNDTLLRLAKIQIKALTDDEAAQVPELFDEVIEGVEYAAGDRVRGRDGKLYKAKKGHRGKKQDTMDAELFAAIAAAVSGNGKKA